MEIVWVAVGGEMGRRIMPWRWLSNQAVQGDLDEESLKAFVIEAVTSSDLRTLQNFQVLFDEGLGEEEDQAPREHGIEDAGGRGFLVGGE